MITPKFIFARYNEDISWIYDYPVIADNAIIYNKGPELSLNKIYKTEIINLSNNPNWGRESDTHLTHIINNLDNIDDYIIFSQADPFDHSPEFIDIVLYMIKNQEFKSFQPLTHGWKINERVPPIENILYDTREYVGPYQIYMETVEERLYPIGYTDRGILGTLSHYRNVHRITDITKTLKHVYHILDLNIPYCGFLKFNYGGIFGVSKDKILKNDKDFYIKLKNFVLKDWSHGFIMERLWYTIFN
jgi:hypothetical protein